MKLRWTFLSVLTMMLTACGAAAIDTSKSYSRGVINRGAIVPAESVRVHEYLNYYEQSLPRPLGEPLSLDLRLGNPEVAAAGGPVWLQIGLQARQAEGTARSPLNLALVLDASGSMAAADKMPYLKQSLRLFLQSLRPDDHVAIIAYADHARVLHPSSPVGDGAWIGAVVDGLQPSGGTNLYAGLMEGFEQADRHYDRRRNNRVLLLTDGRANRGITDRDRIAADAEAYNERGIQLSTVGLGLDLNDSLLSTLAHQGRGVYHFIDSAEEMERVFREEVSGLVERVAREVFVSIETAPGVELVEIVGAESSPSQDGARVRLQDMGADDSQILLCRLEVVPSHREVRSLAEVTVTYEDAFAERPRSIDQSVTVSHQRTGAHDPLLDLQVRRNVTIVRSARALIQIDELVQAGRIESAWHSAADMERQLRSLAIQLDDPELGEDADLFARYKVTLASALGYDPEQEELLEATPRPGYDEPIDPLLPTVEVR